MHTTDMPGVLRRPSTKGRKQHQSSFVSNVEGVEVVQTQLLKAAQMGGKNQVSVSKWSLATSNIRRSSLGQVMLPGLSG